MKEKIKSLIKYDIWTLILKDEITASQYALNRK